VRLARGGGGRRVVLEAAQRDVADRAGAAAGAGGDDDEGPKLQELAADVLEPLQRRCEVRGAVVQAPVRAGVMCGVCACV